MAQIGAKSVYMARYKLLSAIKPAAQNGRFLGDIS
jgi:hypothetical protein